jgi:hypothetical protein
VCLRSCLSASVNECGGSLGRVEIDRGPGGMLWLRVWCLSSDSMEHQRRRLCQALAARQHLVEESRLFLRHRCGACMSIPAEESRLLPEAEAGTMDRDWAWDIWLASSSWDGSLVAAVRRGQVGRKRGPINGTGACSVLLIF